MTDPKLSETLREVMACGPNDHLPRWVRRLLAAWDSDIANEEKIGREPSYGRVESLTRRGRLEALRRCESELIRAALAEHEGGDTER